MGGLEARWGGLRQEGLEDTPFPCWDDLTLSLARAICKGEWSVTVEPPDDRPQEVAGWLASLRTHFPMIRVDVEDTQAVEEGNRAFVEYGESEAAKEEARHGKEMREIKALVKPFGGTVVTTETFHDALDAYKAWIEKTFVDIGGRTTQTGKKRASGPTGSSGTPRTCPSPTSGPTRSRPSSSSGGPDPGSRRGGAVFLLALQAHQQLVERRFPRR